MSTPISAYVKSKGSATGPAVAADARFRKIVAQVVVRCHGLAVDGSGVELDPAEPIVGAADQVFYLREIERSVR